MLSFRDSDKIRKKYPSLARDTELDYEGCECELAEYAGALIARVFDDTVGYTFTYPIEVGEGFSVSEALAGITDFCVREGIPEIITGVPADCLGLLLSGVRHAEVHAQDLSGEYFAVEIKTELSMLDTDIDIEYEGIRLITPSCEYKEDYARLVADREHNKYYGYEVTDDISDATPAEMLAELLRELDSRITLTLFVTEGDVFVGEAVLYAFDGRGCAELSFRVAKEHTRRGLGRKILNALTDIAENMGLLTLKARATRENTPSLKLLLSEGFIKSREEDGVACFTKELI